MPVFNFLLSTLLTFGYPAIAVAVLLTTMGVPLPGIAIMLIVGSLATSDDKNLLSLFVLVTCSSVTGDVIDYMIGRKLKYTVIEKLKSRSSKMRKVIVRAEVFFKKWSSLSIFLSRWLVTPTCAPISLLSGITEYPFLRFFVLDVTGEILSTIIFLSLGYVFSTNLSLMWDILNRFWENAILLCFGLVLIHFGLKQLRKLKKGN